MADTTETVKADARDAYIVAQTGAQPCGSAESIAAGERFDRMIERERERGAADAVAYELRTANLLATVTATYANGSAMFPGAEDALRGQVLARLGLADGAPGPEQHDADECANVVGRVLAIHRRLAPVPGLRTASCKACETPWPCPTARAVGVQG